MPDLQVPPALDLSEWADEWADRLAGWNLDVDLPWVESAIAQLIGQAGVQTAWTYWPDTFEHTIKTFLENYWLVARSEGFVEPGGFLDDPELRGDLWEECVIVGHDVLTQAYADAAIAEFLPDEDVA